MEKMFNEPILVNTPQQLLLAFPESLVLGLLYILCAGFVTALLDR